MSADLTAPWPAAFFELNGEYINADRHTGQRSWYVRAQNVVTVITWAAKGEVLREPPAPDEHAILVLDGVEIEVADDIEQITASGPSLVIAPPGQVTATMRRAGYIVRAFTTRSAVLDKAVNNATYSAPNARVNRLASTPELVGDGSLRLVPLDNVAEVPGQLGRIYTTDSIMINWFSPQDGPGDTDDLWPHAHDDFEQVSITLAGEYVQHIRRPWTKRMRDWRPDEHVQVTSPSVTIIPPGNVHARRGVGPDRHQVIDVFAPPITEFVERGWVRNQADYTPAATEE